MKAKTKRKLFILLLPPSLITYFTAVVYSAHYYSSSVPVFVGILLPAVYIVFTALSYVASDESFGPIFFKDSLSKPTAKDREW